MKLHITNGDCAGEMLKASDKIEGDVLCWRDLLHDGPVLSLPYVEYSAKRVAFLVDLLVKGDCSERLSVRNIESDFIERARVLANINAYDEVVLWFEHDLYDQLQLIEICHRLVERDDVLPPLSIICIDGHSEVPFFHGFGNLTTEMMEGLFQQRIPLSCEQLDIGADLWIVLTSSTPQLLALRVQSEVKGWPFMTKALRRFCMEFPALETGLTLTQTYLLLTLLKAPDELPVLAFNLKLAEQNGSLADGVTAEQRYYEILTGPASFRRIFNHLQQLEVDPFMGDLSVQYELNRLLNADVPYINVSSINENKVYSLTLAGAEVLQGRRHWGADNAVDLWRGGVHLKAGNMWFWDQHSHAFVLKPA